MRKEYNLRNGRPNPYARRLGAAGRKKLSERFLEAEHLVRLDDEVAEAFPSEEAVNEALRLVLRLRDLTPRPPRKTSPRLSARAASAPSPDRGCGLHDHAEVVGAGREMSRGSSVRPLRDHPTRSHAHLHRLLGGLLVATSPRLDWATLLRRTYASDVLSCPRCHDRMRVLAAITAPDVARQILERLRVATAARQAARARDPTWDERPKPELSQ